MEDTNQGQPAPVASDAAAAGTAEPTATDVAASAEPTTEAAPPAGTEDTSSSTAAAEETATTDDTKTRRERQREARKQAATQTPPPEPVKTREQIIAEHEAAQAAAREAQERQHAERMKFARRIGDDPADPNNPQGPTRYQKLQAEASTPIPDGDEQFYTEETRQLVARVNRARQQLADLDERRALLNDVYTPAQQAARLEARDWLGNELERGIGSLGLDVGEIIASVKDPNTAIPTIVQTIGERVRAAVTAELQPKIDDLEDDLAAKDSEIDSLRRQLGGSAAQPLRGGAVAAGSTPVYTRERLAQMLRTPEGIAEYRRNQAEIARQEAAGLIR